MPAKNPKDVKESRRQRGFAVLEGRNLNPSFQKEYEKALSKFKNDHKEVEANLKIFNDFLERLPWEEKPKAQTIEDAFSLTPECKELQKKYGTSIPITTENIGIVANADTFEDIPSLFLLENGGRAAFLDSDPLNGNYLTVHIDMRRLSTDIIAEVQEILRDVKKSCRFTNPADMPTRLEFKIFKLWKEGKKPAQIIRELVDERWPGGSERSRFDNVQEAEKKVQKWAKATKPTKV